MYTKFSVDIKQTQLKINIKSNHCEGKAPFLFIKYVYIIIDPVYIFTFGEFNTTQ